MINERPREAKETDHSQPKRLISWFDGEVSDLEAIIFAVSKATEILRGQGQVMISSTCPGMA